MQKQISIIALSIFFQNLEPAENTAIDPKFVDKDWRKLNLPHDWAVELPFCEIRTPRFNFSWLQTSYGMFPETSIGWYRKHFTVSKTIKRPL